MNLSDSLRTGSLSITTLEVLLYYSLGVEVDEIFRGSEFLLRSLDEKTKERVHISIEDIKKKVTHEMNVLITANPTQLKKEDSVEHCSMRKQIKMSLDELEFQRTKELHRKKNDIKVSRVSRGSTASFSSRDNDTNDKLFKNKRIL
mmetsp:Transcript_10328/g.10317  ORF Transcript_10328/g.10317 Transcript_10328/m.10317 type:complete len:146 (+) Transcript_10328:118-555(+)